jgi:hypothetical protein
MLKDKTNSPNNKSINLQVIIILNIVGYTKK